MGSLETISTTLDWLLLYMGKHPQVQAKLQAEIDALIGVRNQPKLSDRPNTPYVHAVIQELLRCSSLIPLAGVAKRALEDAELCGYKIPKNTLLIGNAYGVHHDPDLWGDPHVFRPERFLSADGTVNKKMVAITLPFSVGKRSCFGESLARDQIYLYVTSIFQRFSVRCSEDVTIQCTAGIARAPKPFQITITKRFHE